ncbi:hypothetical protein PHO31112_02943 [Pandoraea horticolens]|uniref:Uncharacterized protein n=1 Tax=Pandoraea horticolens TaxID=2508298 RepID=A0A5E4VXJ1_9BURK|nr:hypothetical protein PHO31112_02943 [Pandoraea horticolens]
MPLVCQLPAQRPRASQGRGLGRSMPREVMPASRRALQTARSVVAPAMAPEHALWALSCSHVAIRWEWGAEAPNAVGPVV